MALHIFWQPTGVNLDQLGQSKHIENSDGDTPKIEMPIRMLSMDTPEKKNVTSGLSKAEIEQFWPQLPGWFDSGDSPVPGPLADYLKPRVARATAWQTHWDQGAESTDALNSFMDQRLTRPTGTRRRLFLRAADERFDRYGRLLAYVAPSYDADERADMTRYERRTFNFQMVEMGWAPTLMIYPSIPNERDLPMLQQAAQKAVEEQRGHWADDLLLLAYEYRMLEKLVLILQKQQLGETIDNEQYFGWVTRYCCDISDGLIYPPADYWRVAPWNRLFIWPDDIRAAVADLNLRPAPEFATPI
ncbi:MAG: thermonuclease family protein [Pseudomonadota bacterium]